MGGNFTSKMNVLLMDIYLMLVVVGLVNGLLVPKRTQLSLSLFIFILKIFFP
jgi:hypothetical protein